MASYGFYSNKSRFKSSTRFLDLPANRFDLRYNPGKREIPAKPTEEANLGNKSGTKKQINKTDIRRALMLTALAFFIALIYVFLTPIWQAPDEPSHAGYIQYLRENSALPSPLATKIPDNILDQAKTALAWPEVAAPLPMSPKVLPAEDFAYRGLMYTANHPPLYYVLAQPFAAIGMSAAKDKTAGLVYGSRIFSALLTSLTVGLAFLAARALGLSPTAATGVSLLLIVQPQFMFISTSVNNDILTTFLFSLLFLLLLREIRQPPKRNHLALGLVVGLGMLSKITFWLAWPLLWIAALIPASGKSTTSRLTRAAIASALALAVSSWWFIGNLSAYGSLWYVIGGQGLGQATVSEFWRLSLFYRWLFKSYWGFFGWMSTPFPRPLYIALAAICLAAAVGFALTFFKRRPPADKKELFLAALFPAANFIGAVAFRIVAQTGQGRYLFPAIVPATIIIVVGLLFWLGGKREQQLVSALVLFFLGISIYSLITIAGLT